MIAGGATGPIAEMRLADLQRTLDINLTTVLLGTKHAPLTMKAAGTIGGTIINNDSIAGIASQYAPAGMARCSNTAPAGSRRP